ncbi:hypothetical protein CXB51_023565 [Gossypium anomalum]|uniref:Serine/threonine-protein phosphatase 2A regulatory subunit B'' subunit TON2 n=1 Tax=Gossypium anomalum TaxID=47600 RepID=A0A8J5YLR4_9ROSI|nr:hypothetical protein CXB51_023565 [Gossypium anomalum]
MYGGSSDGDGHKAATQRKIPPASSMLWAPEPSSVHRNRCRTWLRSSNEDSHRKWIEGGDYGLCIEDVRDEIWDMVKPVDLH